MSRAPSRSARPHAQRKAPRSRAETVRPGLYDEVTQRIVGELEAGRVPWVQPWGTSGCGNAGLPRNAVSRRPYSGINVLILWSAVIDRAYPSQDWLTFNQAQKLGGTVRKGERGVTVVYADRFTPEDETARTKGEHEPRSIPFLKRFTVFNVAQCDGLSAFVADPAPLAECETLPLAEAVIRASGVEYRIGGNEAFYAPIFDFVQVPPPPAFFAPVDYYRTALHELTHATGHASRVGRDLTHCFGSDGYAREELVAELGSAFLCAVLGIAPSLRHADYLAHWLAVLKADNRAIFRAASAASKAADWLVARSAATADEAAA
ncbi:MAG TPA: zincin-like metallopeptidase domain-containing protein [Sphingomonas sp.]|uniref:ArdC family protein n=1 Tax=Sphingomonas sp. TaxID=28214 RepID=UPI002CE29F1E|nr:zincin-like metallopeptidase domain-containing protein [Sphingomonas sp.]HMI20865.1 zincin-like metallopeptidase domain-containing protein [Sphingomonas sp.]